MFIKTNSNPVYIHMLYMITHNNIMRKTGPYLIAAQQSSVLKIFKCRQVLGLPSDQVTYVINFHCIQSNPLLVGTIGGRIFVRYLEVSTSWRAKYKSLSSDLRFWEKKICPLIRGAHFLQYLLEA